MNTAPTAIAIFVTASLALSGCATAPESDVESGGIPPAVGLLSLIPGAGPIFAGAAMLSEHKRKEARETQRYRDVCAMHGYTAPEQQRQCVSYLELVYRSNPG